MRVMYSYYRTVSTKCVARDLYRSVTKLELHRFQLLMKNTKYSSGKYLQVQVAILYLTVCN